MSCQQGQYIDVSRQRSSFCGLYSQRSSLLQCLTSYAPFFSLLLFATNAGHIRNKKKAPNIITVDGHEEDLLWFNLQEQMIDIVEDGKEDLVLGQTEVGIGVVW
jgi:hypothetical protein